MPDACGNSVFIDSALCLVGEHKSVTILTLYYTEKNRNGVFGSEGFMDLWLSVFINFI